MHPVLLSGLNLALIYLAKSLDDDLLPHWMTTAFGTGWELEQGKQLIYQLGIGRQIPPIEIVAASQIHSAKGAYAHDRGRIYLSEEFLNTNLDRPTAIAAVLLEELGHYIDSVLNSIDSPGDEGAIFATLIQGQTLTDGELTSLKAEDDRTVATIDGQTLQLELAATYGNITVDGNLGEWTVNERLDFLPGTSQTGYEFYGKYAQDAYVFAINSAQVIGTGTTIWLNTDRDNSTGFQPFGNTVKVGAEYNINFATDGQAYLYRDDSATSLVGALDYALSADGKSVEIAITGTQLGGTSPTAIDVWADVNNNVFLPGDYSLNKFTVSQNPFVPKNTYGNLTLDGNLNDWNQLDRLDFLPNTGNTNYQIYGRYTQDGYVFAINSQDLVIGQNTTIWLNTDRNRSTGQQIFDTPGSNAGAEFNLNIGADGKAYLYSGRAGQNFVSKLDYAVSEDRKTLEVAVRNDLLGNLPAIDIWADVNNEVFLPGNYNAQQYTVNSRVLPQRTDLSKKVGIVYSETSADKFFEKKSYSRLFMNVQQQAIQAGIPFDLLTEQDLTDINKVAQYDTLVFPSFSHVNSSLVTAIEENLTDAVYKYGTNLVAAGNFMTNDETGTFIGGNRMQNLLGVTPDFKNLQQIDGLAANAVVDAVVKAKDISGGILQGYTTDEQIYSYQQTAQFSLPVFNSWNGTGTVLAEQVINGKNYNAVITTKTGGNNIHFASEGILANSNLLWQGLQSQVLGSGAKVGLSMTRDHSLLMTRNDVDLSKYRSVAVAVENKLGDILADWKSRYGFVGSHYINIGVDGSTPEGQATIACCCPYCVSSPERPEGTDWNVMRPIYQKWLALGNEIGTHSYTHPFFTADLTPEQIKFEFDRSRQEISEQLGIKVTGAATPGNPEDYGSPTIDANGNSIPNSKQLYVDREIEKHFGTPEIQGYMTGVGAGYTNAFGFLTPDAKIVFFEPNTSFDFNLVQFRGLTAPQAELVWEQEYKNLNRHANLAMIEFAIHDYSLTEFEPGYTRAMFENFIARAYNDGTEFVTLDDAQKRIRTFDNAQLFVNQIGDTVTAKIVSNDVGKFALDINQGKIKSVTNWYAYSDDKVFLPKTGGEFQINLGTVADKVTRIIDLPQRAELLSVLGDGKTLDFSFKGEGTVILNVAGITSDNKLATIGADSVTVKGDLVELNFNQHTTHTAKIFFKPDELPIVVNPLANIIVKEDASRTTIDLAQVFSDPDDDISQIIKTIQTNSNTGLVSAQIVGNTLTLDYLANQFGTADITIRGTSNGKVVDSTFKLTVSAVDDAPTVLNAIANITVNQDAPNTTIDLAQVFTDLDNDANLIVKSVQANTNLGLVKTSLNGNTLTLDYLQDRFGQADITIRGTSNGQTVDTTFKVTVNDLYASYNQIQGSNKKDLLFGGTGNDRIYGLNGDDTIYAFGGTDRLFGDPGNDILLGSSGNDYLLGGTGNDRLSGDSGDDILIGVDPNSINPGRGEIDTLTDIGLSSIYERDRLILGDANSVYYNDGNANSNGTGDYALLSGFVRDRDIIQLKGTANDYSLGAAPRGLPSGTAIYWRGDGQLELIGIVSQQSNLNLSSNYFSYV
jgi:hypothetical protein